MPRCKDCHNLTQREKYLDNLDHITKRRQKLRINNTNIERKRRLTKKNLNKETWAAMLLHQNNQCNGCSRVMPIDFYEIDHINSVSSNNSIDNLQLLCSTCNNIKHNNTMDYLYWHILINGVQTIPYQQLPYYYIPNSVKIIKAITDKQKYRIQQYNNRKWKYIRKKYKINEEEWHILLSIQRDLCNGCGRLLPTDLLTIDHVIPKFENGKHNIDNYQILCRKCNLIKGDRPMEYLIKYRSVNSAPIVPYQKILKGLV